MGSKIETWSVDDLRTGSLHQSVEIKSHPGIGLGLLSQSSSDRLAVKPSLRIGIDVEFDLTNAVLPVLRIQIRMGVIDRLGNRFPSKSDEVQDLRCWCQVIGIVRPYHLDLMEAKISVLGTNLKSGNLRGGRLLSNAPMLGFPQQVHS